MFALQGYAISAPFKFCLWSWTDSRSDLDAIGPSLTALCGPVEPRLAEMKLEVKRPFDFSRNVPQPALKAPEP
ncbi:hypothetical protein ABLE91_10700 [Aquabacter sp. CN5-332]|uniref:hypothetical protein n=1 Tax=Aquabacter sp. CN5-332 TaxID=3156608 RepID=UPI0032B39DF9